MRKKNSKVKLLVLSGDIMHIRKQTEQDTLHTVDVLQFKTPVTAFCFDLPWGYTLKWKCAIKTFSLLKHLQFS